MSLSDAFAIWIAGERALIGMLLKNGSSLTEALAFGIEPGMFVDDVCRRVFSAVLVADKDGRTITLRDCYALFPDVSEDITTMVSRSPIAQNLSYYAEEVANAAWQRETYESLSSLANAVADRSPYQAPEQIKSRALSTLERVAYGERHDAKGPKSMDVIMETVIPDVQRQVELYRSGQPTGISTGLPVIDSITGGGLKPGHYTIVAARPGIGKTALAVFVAKMAADAGHRSLFFTVEMTRDEIAKRFLALESRVPGGRIDLGSLSAPEIDRIMVAQKSLAGSLLDIDDSTGGHFEAFESACRRVKRQHGLSLVVLDYLQLFTLGKQANRVGMLTDISNRIKRLALELKIAVIVVSQINREAERDGGPPSLHQLKDTGALEQDADLALLLYQEGPSLFVNVAKNRRGKWGFVFPLKADLATNYFEGGGSP